MKRRFFCFISMALLLVCLPTPGGCESITIYPSDDTHVTSYNPFAIWGVESDRMSAGRTYYSGSPNTNRLFVKFPLHSIPVNATITSAQLSLFCSSFEVSSFYALHYVGDGWSESTMYWNNQPSYGQLLDMQTVDATGWKTWNPLANGNWNWKADIDDKYVSFMLKLSNETLNWVYTVYNTTENGSNTPRLIITYSIPSKSSATSGLSLLLLDD
jgi:hypothetical protein